MKKFLKYSAAEIESINGVLEKKLLNIKNKLSFWEALDEVFSNIYIDNLIKKKGANSSDQKLSAGTSVKNAPSILLKTLTESIRSNNYRFYTPSCGSEAARQAIAVRESISANLKSSITVNNVVMSVGSTGAISSVFEITKKLYPNGQVIIAAPTYYLYKFCARYYGLDYIEVSRPLSNVQSSFLCFEQILSAINARIKLLCIVNPTNPTGEYYSQKQIEDVLAKAKQFGTMVLVDELFNFLDYKGITNRSSSLKAAEKVNAEENLILVNGFSKSQNLAGLRIGYSITRNDKWLKCLNQVNQVRFCFPIGYQYDEMIQLDCVIRSIKTLIERGSSKDAAIKKVCQAYGVDIDQYRLDKQFGQYWKQSGCALTDYTNQLLESDNILSGITDCSVKPQAGFNSFRKIKLKDKINYFDFALNCFLATGVKIELGPCYGLGQKYWEKSDGIWLRLTTARNKKTYKNSLNLFRSFVQSYPKNKILDIDMRFD